MSDELTDAEKLAALETYLRVLKPLADTLRAKVTAELGATHTERIGAYLPDGTKLASVAHSQGRLTAKVIDEAAALRWCEQEHPDEVVRAINPAFLKQLLDYAKKGARVGDKGVDPTTGERLDFIEVQQGNPFITITTTDEGVERIAALANGFTAMLEGPK